MAGNADLPGNRVPDWEMARHWLLHERVTRMAVKVRRQFYYQHRRAVLLLLAIFNVLSLSVAVCGSL